MARIRGEEGADSDIDLLVDMAEDRGFGDYLALVEELEWQIAPGFVAITGETTRERVHLLRAQSDAIMTGIGTALADDPILTCRLPGMADRSPVRIVLDGKPRLPSRPSTWSGP